MQHRCSFCGWHRGDGSATLLDPQCQRCGCVLDAVPAPLPALVAAPTEARSLLVARRMTAALLLVGIVPLVLVAAKLGYAQGGVPMATGGAVTAGLLLYVFLAPAHR